MSDEKSSEAKPEIDLPPIPEPILPADTTPELQTINTTTENDAPNYFEFKHVSKGFDGRPVLDDVSFFVKRGETCVIMGRSGVGKSVSLKHILGFLKPDSGQIFIDGQD
ncbi:MAG TPA: ATP-binding cassette domain-containing protein, partial [Verrucomicrobiae bacterium]|nr:ATP-binding cassette domain-containing protein [Verrucomicrobiae bacterium]